MSNPNTFDIDKFNIACLVSTVDIGAQNHLEDAFKIAANHLPVEMVFDKRGNKLERGEVFGELIDSVSDAILDDNESKVSNPPKRESLLGTFSL